MILEITYLFYIRTIHGTAFTWRALRGTRAVWASLAVVVPAQFAVTYVPVLQRVFGTEAVAAAAGLLMVAIGAVFLVILELER